MTDWARYSNPRRREFGGPHLLTVPLGPGGTDIRNAPLITSANTKKSEKLIRSVARAKFGRKQLFDVFFEHGQWWAFVGPTGEDFWSAVDAVPGFDGRGIDFEEIG
jgi:hypothetical protein